jgi:hypothetical protein
MIDIAKFLNAQDAGILDEAEVFFAVLKAGFENPELIPHILETLPAGNRARFIEWAREICVEGRSPPSNIALESNLRAPWKHYFVREQDQPGEEGSEDKS